MHQTALEGRQFIIHNYIFPFTEMPEAEPVTTTKKKSVGTEPSNTPLDLFSTLYLEFFLRWGKPFHKRSTFYKSEPITYSTSYFSLELQTRLS